MLIKRRPPQFIGFVENKYRHEHVMITKLYIVSNILYDHYLYEYMYILWAFCACLKEAMGCTHPPPSCGMHFVQPASVPIWEMWQLGRDTIMYPPSNGRSEMDPDSERQSRGMTWPVCKQFLAMLQVCWHCLARRKKMFQTVW